MRGVLSSRRNASRSVVRAASAAASVVVEMLESRQLLSAVYPTAADQYMIQLINRARANPAGEAAADGISLNEGLAAGTISSTPKQPLAFNPYLTGAATSHSQWMLDNSTFQHNDSLGDPGAQMSAAGYAFTGTWTWGQNIAWQGSYPNAPSLYPTTAQEDQSLFVDSSEPGRGHRLNMLNDSYKEVGAGIVTGTFYSGGQGYNAVMTSEDFALSGSGTFLTGVVYNDSDRNNFYTPGEGLGGVTITAQRTSDNAVFSTSTWAAGGYTLQLPAGTYYVTAAGGNFGNASGYTVTIGSRNVEQDFNPGVSPANPPTSSAVGSISGSYFYDSNGNGAWDSGEGISPYWQVYIDANNDGRYDSGDTQIVANGNGQFTFSGLSAGTYVIRSEQASGWTQTAPANTSAHVVTLAAGQNVTNVNFGVLQGTPAVAPSSTTGSISGSYFYDSNGNGNWDSGETTSPYWLVYIDANSDGKYDSGDTEIRANGSGQFTFSGLAAGTYVIRSEQAGGWTQTAPTNAGAHVVTLAAGQNVTDMNFGVVQGTPIGSSTTSTASISGTFFYDSNGNGAWDSNETISPQWYLYLDVNRDGVYDSGDVLTRADTAGRYSFTGLAAGTYSVRAATASGWQQTTVNPVITVAAGQSVTGVNFGERMI